MPPAADLSNFIRSTFRSVWALELLCFLRQHRDRSVGHAEMVAGLRGSDLVVTQSIASLEAAGLLLVEPGGGARYAPASKDLDALAGAAAEAYARGPDAVRRLIVSAANPGAAAFADAFRIRKD
jgi:hypothetical protein